MLVFGIYNNISNHFYFHFLESLNWQQSIYFSTIHYKTCGNKIDEEGLHLLLYLIIQNIPPLCWLLDQTKYLLILRALDMWTSSELYFFRTFARKKMAYIQLLIDVLDLKWSMSLVCSFQASQNLSSSFFSALATQILDFSPPFSCRSVGLLPSYKGHH